MARVSTLLSAFAIAIASLAAQSQTAPGQPPPPRRALPQVTQEFISVDAPIVALQHVRVIDGTGAPAAADQNLIIEGGTIKAIGPSASTPPPAGARVLDLAGR